MSTTNKTSEYQLSQVEQNDVPSWIADYSADMAKIDAALAHNRNNVSSKFSEDTDYIKGKYCIKDDVLYKFTDAKPSGAWDSSKVEAVTVEGELEAHATAISEQNVKMTDYVLIRQFSQSLPSVPANGAASFQIPISIPEGYKRVGIVRAWVADSLMFVFNAFMSDSETVSCNVRNLNNTEIKNAMCYVQILFQKT